MNKKIKLEDGNMINIEAYNGQIIINKGYIEDGEPVSILTMSMTDDFTFEASNFSRKKTDSISFVIPKLDPLYKHFDNALGEDDELIIDDDLENEEKQKYLRIQREADDLAITFNNHLEDDLPFNRFFISVINVMHDGRSKIDQQGLDTKERLARFFREVKEDLLLDKNIDER